MHRSVRQADALERRVGAVGRPPCRRLSLVARVAVAVAVAAGAAAPGSALAARADAASSPRGAVAPSDPSTGRPSATGVPQPGLTWPSTLTQGVSAPTPAEPALLMASTAPGATTVSASPSVVLPGLDPAAPRPTSPGLATLLRALVAAPGLGTSVSLAVADAATGTTLFAQAPDAARVPASTAKILTAAAVLSLLGSSATLPTRVVDGATRDEVVLVGGGDVLLSAGSGDPLQTRGRAGLDDLAAATADALLDQGRTTVAVRLDDSLFVGPAVSSAWGPADVASGAVAPIMALEVDEGRVRPGDARRSGDPAMAAAATFAGLLARHGVHVAAAIARTHALAQAGTLAQVDSASVGDLVEFALTESDNTVAEALARLVARASGRPATFVDAGVAVLDRASLLGVSVTNAHLVGGSGLARNAAVPVSVLVGVLAAAAQPSHPELRPVLSGLPVAGVSGTLASRFTRGPDLAGAGVVRAKTGTLRGVTSLAGTVVDADGRLLVFAVLADRVPTTAGGRAALDRVAAALAGCGCR